MSASESPTNQSGGIENAVCREILKRAQRQRGSQAAAGSLTETAERARILRTRQPDKESR